MYFTRKIVGLGMLIATCAIDAQASFITLPAADSPTSFSSQKLAAADAAFAELSAGGFDRLAPGAVAEAPGAATAIVPEPSTYALLLASLGLLTWVMNRRRD